MSIGVGVALGVLLPRIHGGAQTQTGRTIDVLITIGFGVLGLVSIIFSLLFLVVEYSNTALTPRLNLFQGDPWIWRTYGVCLGLFTYAIAASLAIGDEAHVTMAVPIVSLAVALLVIGLMRRLQVKAFASMQLSATLAAIATAGRRVIDDLYANDPDQPPPVDAADPPRGGRPVRWNRPSATLEQLDVRKILDAAGTDDTVVFAVAVGGHLGEASVIAEVTGGIPDGLVRGACVTGVDRTFNQDPLLAFRLLSDIGLRALSPAVNDPATAAQALDAIVGLLTPLSVRDLDVGVLPSATGQPCVWLLTPVWGQFVSEGLDELLLCAGRSPLVLADAERSLERLHSLTGPDRKEEVGARLSWVQARSCDVDPFSGGGEAASVPG